MPARGVSDRESRGEQELRPREAPTDPRPGLPWSVAAEHPADRALQRLGAWLHPLTGYPRHSRAERQLQWRAGLVGLVCIAGGLAVLVASLAHLALTGLGDEIPGAWQVSHVLPVAVALVVLSVFAPQAVFRSRSAVITEQVLTNPTTPIRPWRATTVAFDPVLVGAMLAGLAYGPAVTVAFFGTALVIRVLLQSRRTLNVDANARYHSVVIAASSFVTGAVAYAVVRSLAPLVIQQDRLTPLLLAALVALYVGLAINVVERWVNGDRSRWAFLRDAVDIRRIVVAVISALIAWLGVLGAQLGPLISSTSGDLAGALVCLGVFVACWLTLWFISIRLWRRDSLRTLMRWGRHQAEVINRIADGSLSPDLAARAALPVTARMALSVFGATRALVVLDDGRERTQQFFVGADLYGTAAPTDPASLAGVPHLRIPLYVQPGHANTSSVTVGGWLWPGWFMVRTKTIVDRFRELATESLLTPVVASRDDQVSAAFDAMFDPTRGWPTTAAFQEAVERLQARTDESPHSASLLVGVYAIDDFGALAGGRFEQAAVGQVMRLISGYQDLAGHETFLAYEAPGRIWLALTGGPMIRSGVALLNDLQRYINDHGAVPAARLDIDVHVSVSFGYAVHQVDEFAFTGLRDAALDRLAIDQSARSPFTVGDVITRDIRPEDIIGGAEAPVTVVDATEELRRDRLSPQAPELFPTTCAVVRTVESEEPRAVVLEVGWRHSFGSLDLVRPGELLRLANRQPEFAAEATRAILARHKETLATLAEQGRPDLPVVVALPSVLLHPDAGQLALPNLLSPFLDRAESARTVVLVDLVPAGGGEAVRLLSDRGIGVAVTAAAAATVAQSDLYGWQRWAIVLPPHIMASKDGIDGLTIQQTSLAIATHGTHLIGVVDRLPDARQLETHGISLIVDRGAPQYSAAEVAALA